MRTIAVANQKGGVGKTTVAINLSAALAKEGRRTLVVDMDPQGHCAVGVAVPEEKIDRGIGDCLIAAINAEKPDVSDVTWRIAPNLDLAPASAALALLETPDARRDADPDALSESLGAVAHRYDYCVIDCPAHPGVLTRLAVSAADDILVPVETGYFSIHELDRQLAGLREIARENGRAPRLHVVPNLYDVRTKMAREILSELRRVSGEVMTEAVINFNTKLKESASYGQAITEFAPGSMGARDFQKLARELLACAGTDATLVENVDAIADRLARDSDRLLATSTPLIQNRAREPVSRPAGTVPAEAEASSDAHERISRALETIYGARQEAETVVFRTRSPGASRVQIAGDFNDWSPHKTPMRRNDETGVFEASLKLPSGRYRYRLVVDGRWSYDRDNPELESDEYGEINSVVEVH